MPELLYSLSSSLPSEAVDLWNKVHMTNLADSEALDGILKFWINNHMQVLSDKDLKDQQANLAALIQSHLRSNKLDEAAELLPKLKLLRAEMSRRGLWFEGAPRGMASPTNPPQLSSTDLKEYTREQLEAELRSRSTYSLPRDAR